MPQRSASPSSRLDEPQRIHIPLMATERVVRVVCGGEHSVAWTTAGRLFAFGGNNVGQLGVGGGRDDANDALGEPGRRAPSPAPLLRRERQPSPSPPPPFVRSTSSQSLDGEDDATAASLNVETPTAVPLPPDMSRVAAVAAGGEFTAVLDGAGDMWMAGMVPRRLGHGERPLCLFELRRLRDVVQLGVYDASVEVGGGDRNES
mmetsp:Transcript_16532/g.47046  ORF Transcript_16532/g.47046 Transcript_16532/m.47046 type:complete len:204 (+) Transcript_16532:1-612(+)